MLATMLIPDVDPDQLARYAALIYEKIGVTISPQKATLLSNRLRRRLRATGVKDYDAYYQLLLSKPLSDSEWQSFLQEITTHETYLYRDEQHWKWFREAFLPQLRAKAQSGARPKILRCWSAACSTGDEAATIACCIAECLPDAEQWKIEIVGTDIAIDAVRQASTAQFGERSMRNVKPGQKLAYFKPQANGQWELKPLLRRWMRFQTHNLLHPLRDRPFDLVFLKNVLIYFDRASKAQVIESLKSVLVKGSLLVTGSSEGAHEFLKDFRSAPSWLHCYSPADKR